jgi:hypothetical protein
MRTSITITVLILTSLTLGQGCPGMGNIPTGDGPDGWTGASQCTSSDLTGTWRLVNESTWNEITLDASGAVTGGDHPHGVTQITGQLTIDGDCNITGSYTIVDEESLQNDPPTPQGTWAYEVTGSLLESKAGMILDYTLQYTPEGEDTETYTGTWHAAKQ